MKEWLITVFFPFLCVEEQGEENVAYLLEWKKEGCIAKGGKLCSWAGWVDPGVSRPFKCGRATMYGRPLITGVSVCGRLFMEFESAKKEKEKKWWEKRKKWYARNWRVVLHTEGTKYLAPSFRSTTWPEPFIRHCHRTRWMAHVFPSTFPAIHLDILIKLSHQNASPRQSITFSTPLKRSTRWCESAWKAKKG